MRHILLVANSVNAMLAQFVQRLGRNWRFVAIGLLLHRVKGGAATMGAWRHVAVSSLRKHVEILQLLKICPRPKDLLLLHDLVVA